MIAAIGRRPLLAIVVLGAIIRIGFVLLTALSGDGAVIPDESQYVHLAGFVADGGDPEIWGYDGYGTDLLASTRAFTVPLSWMFRVVPRMRAVGALYAAGFGIALIPVVHALAAHVASRRHALAAAAVACVLPSQVLLSSVSLRESMVWTSVAVTALLVCAASNAERPRRLTAVLAGLAASLVVLGWLRDLTLIVAIWAIVPSAYFGFAGLRRARVMAALVLALVIPVVAGIGIGGSDLAFRALPELGTLRTNLAIQADSGFTETTLVRPGTPTTMNEDGVSVLDGFDGEVYLADERLTASLKSAPRGLIAFLLRPFAWESGEDTSLRLAAMENLVWYVLYGLALLGVVRAVRHRLRETLFPMLFMAGMVLTAAVTQGNLGTAFRHRAQLLPALLVLAAVGADHLQQWRLDRRSSALTDGQQPTVSASTTARFAPPDA